MYELHLPTSIGMCNVCYFLGQSANLSYMCEAGNVIYFIFIHTCAPKC